MLSRCYLFFNKKRRAEYKLLDEMKGIGPLVVPGVFKAGYLVYGTSIIINSRTNPPTWNNPNSKPFENKYDLFISIPNEPWERKVTLEYVLENYSEKYSEKFLFNLNKFS